VAVYRLNVQKCAYMYDVQNIVVLFGGVVHEIPSTIIMHTDGRMCSVKIYHISFLQVFGIIVIMFLFSFISYIFTCFIQSLLMIWQLLEKTFTVMAAYYTKPVTSEL
jgi:hypothetical protein